MRKSRFVEYFFGCLSGVKSRSFLFAGSWRLQILWPEDASSCRQVWSSVSVLLVWCKPCESKSATVPCLYLYPAKLSSRVIAQVSRCQSSSLCHAFMKLWWREGAHDDAPSSNPKSFEENRTNMSLSTAKYDKERATNKGYLSAVASSLISWAQLSRLRENQK